jgi:glucose uptake protein GlcU
MVGDKMLLGYGFAIISSLFFTLYIIPKKLSKQKPMYYTMFMGLGFFIVSLLFYIGHCIINKGNAEAIFHPVLLTSAFGGILWMLGSLFFLTSIDKIGLSRSNQWKNLQGPIGSTLILIFFAEFLTTNFVYIMLAIVTIFISAILFTIKKEEQKKIEIKSVGYAVISAVFFGTNALIMRFATREGFLYAQQLYFSAFVFISAVVYLLIKEKKINELKNISNKKNLLGVIGGAIYYFASYFSASSFKYIEGSIGFTIVQLNGVWTILVGILIFKEIDFKKNWLRIVIGILFAVTGVIMLLLAQK